VSRRNPRARGKQRASLLCFLKKQWNTIEEAEDVGDWLRRTYPLEFGGENKTLVIHTDTSGEVTKKDLDAARKLARDVDNPDCPTNAIVSVLMLREDWDVRNVTVVVGLRPYTASAGILPEQAIGRGLRLMFDGQTYIEQVDIIGNEAFLSFIDQLEKSEDVQLDTFDVGKDKLNITAIMPQLPEKLIYDLHLPRISPILTRKTSLDKEIKSLDVMNFKFSPDPLPHRPGTPGQKSVCDRIGEKAREKEMPKRATLVVLSEEEQTALVQLTKRHKSGQQLVLRAQIVLAAGSGHSNVKIAQELSVSVETVRLWRDRWVAGQGLALKARGVEERLADAPRPGAPARISAEQRCQMEVLAGVAPDQSGRPISQWSGGEIAQEMIKRGIVKQISRRHAARLLKKGAFNRTSSVIG
jgi:transposase